MKDKAPIYRDEILKIMFVAGETSQPSVETTTLVENIVREQTMHVVRVHPLKFPPLRVIPYTDKLLVAGELAARRGEAKFSTNDILFQVRHDPGRLSRLRNHMRWKQIRKRAKVKDEEAPDTLDVDEVDDLVDADDTPGGAEVPGAAGSDSDPSTPCPQSKNISSTLKPKIPEASLPPLPWSILSMFPYTSDIPCLASLDDDEALINREPDSSSDNTTTTNPYLLAQLRKNDERTRAMTAEEYTTWSECRSASFTYRRKKAFREWCGLGVIADYRAKEDVLEILGFLTSEWVQVLTERALAVKEREERDARYEEAARKTSRLKRKLEGEGPFVSREGGGGMDGDKKAEVIPRNPIRPRHVRRAFELLQIPPKKYAAMCKETRLRQRKRRRT